MLISSAEGYLNVCRTDFSTSYEGLSESEALKQRRVDHGCGSCAPVGKITVVDEAKRLTIWLPRGMHLAPLGNRTEYRYDQYGNIRQITDPEGRSTFYRWGSKGELYLVVDQPGNATKLAYDAQGNLVTLTNPLGALTRLEWTAAGRLERIIYPDQTAELNNECFEISWTW
jgi:YD repeat-containing protein